MAERWDRTTTVLAGVGAAPPGAIAAVEAAALKQGIDWSPDAVVLVWATTSTTTAGTLRKRTRTVRTVGFLSPEVLAWSLAEDDDSPHAMVVRRARVDVLDGMPALAALPPDIASAFPGAGADGVTVRGDLGRPEISDVFIGLGTGPDADTVRSALLAR